MLLVSRWSRSETTPQSPSWRGDDSPFDQCFHHMRGRLLSRVDERIEMHLWPFRGFVGRIDTGEVLQVSGPGFGVQTLGIAPDAFIDRGIDKHLDKLSLADQVSYRSALGVVGRDERAKHDE